MSKLTDILRRKAERKARLENALVSITNQLEELGALKIILFGSASRGEVDTNSDLDLFVIMPSKKNSREWMNIIYRRVERKVASNIIAYNWKEFEERVSSSSFLQNVTKGKIIYEKTT